MAMRQRCQNALNAAVTPVHLRHDLQHGQRRNAAPA